MKIKKTLGALIGGTILVVAPIATIISCGANDNVTITKDNYKEYSTWDAKTQTLKIKEGVTTISDVFRRGYPAGKKPIPIMKLDLPKSLITINAMAFETNEFPNQTLVIPASVVSIGDSAFENGSFSAITLLGNKLKTIGMNAFAFAELSSLNIPNSVDSIGPNAFYLSELTALTIPDSVTSIGTNAFLNSAIAKGKLIFQGTITTDEMSDITLGFGAFAQTPIANIAGQAWQDWATKYEANSFKK